MASTSQPGAISGTAVISPAVQQADAPKHPELSKGTWIKRYGRYDFERFDHLNHKDALVGGASIGNVQVDCNLLFAESQWGVLDEADAGIVYIDFHIQQPANYRLDWATIEITLEDVSEPASGLPAQITQYYGPRRVLGPESTKTKLERVNVEPKLEIMGAGGGVGGKEFETMFEVPCRWEFTGNRVSRDKKGKKVFTGLHRTLEWTLKENELDPGQQNLVKTAFAFARQGDALLMKIKVRGGLKGRLDRIKAKFAHRRGSKNGISTTRIGPYNGPKRSLDRLASDLDKVMEFKNQQLAALELPKPQPANFWQVPNQPGAGSQQGDDDAPTPVPNPATLPSSSRPQLLPPAPVSIQIEAAPPTITMQPNSQDRTEPTLENLSSMAELFMRPGLEALRENIITPSIPTSHLSKVATSPSVISSTGFSSAATLVAVPETAMIPALTKETPETKAGETVTPGPIVPLPGTVEPVVDEVALLQEALTKRMQSLRGAFLWMMIQPPKLPVLIFQRLYQMTKWPRLIYRLLLRVLFGI